MDIILIALLYTSTIAEPSVYSVNSVYSDMQECSQEAVALEEWLMQLAPSSDAYVNVQCVSIPKEV